MKKASLSIIFSFTFATLLLALTSPAHAAPTVPTTDITKVRGHVVGPDNKPLKYADVKGICDGKTTTGITNGSGNFLLFFVGTETCGAGSVVNVTVTKDGQTAGGTGTVQVQRDGRFVDVNMSMLSLAFNVPEYDWITYSAAVIGSVGIYFMMRRKFAYSRAS